jgi:ribulose-phosphate 3-epimerase
MRFWQDYPDNRLLVEASLWSADFTRFGAEIQRIDPYIDMYHIDVSDGHFVPGFLFFADLVAALRPLTAKNFHVHLMTDNPLAHIDDFIEAGANLITVHMENGPTAPAALQRIHQAGCAAGLAIGLDIPPESILPYLELIEAVLIMGTPMGVKGVEPSRHANNRISRLRHMIDENGFKDSVKIAADGGIRQHTVPDLRARGADIIVAGSLAFRSQDLAQTFRWLHSLQ